jgi:biopolymer transport protein ExbB/TolQ
MDVGAVIKAVIYVVSSSLLYPTLVLLLLLCVWILFQAGSFAADGISRLRLPGTPPAALATALGEARGAGHFSSRPRRYLAQLEELLAQSPPPPEPVIVKHLQDAISKAQSSLDRLRIAVRLGPGLGLIGTLIPMGTGLAALGEGDLTRLSSDLVIAFTTTVVGLALGITAFFFHTIRRRWIEDDVRMMEFATEVLAGKPAGEGDGPCGS